MRQAIVSLSLAFSASLAELQGAERASPSGVVLSYAFDEGAGSRAADRSGHGNPGAIHGAVAWVQGKAGAALQFNGDDTYVLAPDSESLNSPAATGKLTLEGWLYREETDAGAVLLKKEGCYMLAIIGWDPTRLQFSVWDRTLGFTAVETDTGVLKPDLWQHVAGVCDGQSLRVYVNGRQVAARETPAVPQEYRLSALTIGIGLDLELKPTQGPLLGRFDEVCVANTARGEEYFGRIRADTTENFETTVTRVVRPPRIAAARPVPAGVSARVSRPSDQAIVLENGHARYEITIAPGATLARLLNKYIDTDCLNQTGGSSLFYLMAGDERFDSRDFTTVTAAVDQRSQSQRLRLLLSLQRPAVDAALVVAMDEGPDTTWSLTLTNRSEARVNVRVAFPFLENLRIGENLKDNYYFWPMHTGIVSNKSYALGMDYGRRCWLQVMDVFNPVLGGGVGMWVRDATGMLKGMVLQKTNESGQVRVDYNSIFHPIEKPKQPFTYKVGLAMAVFYMEQELQPTGTFAMPDGVIGVHPGICLDPLRRYSEWAHRTWYRHPPVPEWFRNDFNFVAVHNRAGNAGFVKGFHPADRFIASESIHPDGRDQHLQWSAWWRDPSGDQNTNGWGDYDYNPEWGGLAPLTEEIRKCQARGSRVTFYACSRALGKNTRIAREKGEEWGFMDKPGHPSEDWGAFNMCTHVAGWQDYLAGVYSRIIRDTGVDGMYLDTSCEVLVCANSRHPHAANLIDDQVCLLRKAREGIKSAKSDASFMVEFCGSDYFSQFVDGAWAQTFAHPYARDFNNYDLCFFRFCFPEVKLAEWGQTAATFPVDSRRCLFNGVGIARGDITPEQSDYLAKTGELLRENGDAFATLAPVPFAPTLAENVYANVFPVARKTAIALYNKNDSAFRGPVLRVEPRVGRHYVDVLLDRAVAVVADPGGAALAAELPAMDVTCIAELPAILELRPQAERVVVELRERVHQPTLRYVWDDDQPTRAVALPLVRGRAEVPLSAERAGRKLIVKLYAGVYLADEAVWPEN